MTINLPDWAKSLNIEDLVRSMEQHKARISPPRASGELLGTAPVGAGNITGAIEQEAAYRQFSSLARDPEQLREVPFRELQQLGRRFGVTGKSYEDLIPRITSTAEKVIPPQGGPGSYNVPGPDVPLAQAVGQMTWQDVVGLHQQLSPTGRETLSSMTARREEIHALAQQHYAMPQQIVERILPQTTWETAATASESEWKSQRQGIMLGQLGGFAKQMGVELWRTRQGPQGPEQVFAPYSPRTYEELQASHTGDVSGRVQHPTGWGRATVPQAMALIQGTSLTSKGVPEGYAQRGEQLAYPSEIQRMMPGVGTVPDPQTGELMRVVAEPEKYLKRAHQSMREGRITAAGLPTIQAGALGELGDVPETVQVAKVRFSFGPELISGASARGDVGPLKRDVSRRFRLPEGTDPTVKVGDVLPGTGQLKLFEGHEGLDLREEDYQDLTVTGAHVRPHPSQGFSELLFQAEATLQEGAVVGSKYMSGKSGSVRDSWVEEMGVHFYQRMNEPNLGGGAWLQAQAQRNPELVKRVLGEDVYEEADEEGRLRWKPEFGPKFAKYMQENLQEGWLPERTYSAADPAVAEALKTGLIRKTGDVEGGEGTFRGQQWDAYVDLETAVILEQQQAYRTDKPISGEQLGKLAESHPQIAQDIATRAPAWRRPAVSMFGASLATFEGTASKLGMAFRKSAVNVEDLDLGAVREEARTRLVERGTDPDKIESLLDKEVMQTLGEKHEGRGLYFSPQATGQKQGLYAPNPAAALAYGFSTIEGELHQVPRSLSRLLGLSEQRQLGTTILPQWILEREGRDPDEPISAEERAGLIKKYTAETSGQLMGGMADVTASKEFINRLTGGPAPPGAGGGRGVPMLSMDPERFTMSEELLRTVLAGSVTGKKGGRASQAEIEKVARAVSQGKVYGAEGDELASEQMLMNVWRDPSLSKQQRTFNVSHLGEEEAVRRGVVSSSEEYQSAFASAPGLSPTAMYHGSGDWDLDVLKRMNLSQYQMDESGRVRVTHRAEASSRESILDWAAREPGQELGGILEKFKGGPQALLAAAKQKLGGWAKPLRESDPRLVPWTRFERETVERQAERGPAMGGAYNEFIRAYGEDLRRAGSHPALEATREALAVPYQMALDYQYRRIGEGKTEPDELSPVRDPYTAIHRLGRLKRTTMGWRDEETGKQGFLKGGIPELVREMGRNISQFRTMSGELISPEARAAAMINPEAAPERYEQALSLIQGGKGGTDLGELLSGTPEQLKEGERRLGRLGKVAMPYSEKELKSGEGKLTESLGWLTMPGTAIRRGLHFGIQRAREAGEAVLERPGGGLDITGKGGARGYQYTAEEAEQARLGEIQEKLTATRGGLSRKVSQGDVKATAVPGQVEKALRAATEAGIVSGTEAAGWQDVERQLTEPAQAVRRQQAAQRQHLMSIGHPDVLATSRPRATPVDMEEMQPGEEALRFMQSGLPAPPDTPLHEDVSEGLRIGTGGFTPEQRALHARRRADLAAQQRPTTPITAAVSGGGQPRQPVTPTGPGGVGGGGRQPPTTPVTPAPPPAGGGGGEEDDPPITRIGRIMAEELGDERFQGTKGTQVRRDLLGNIQAIPWNEFQLGPEKVARAERLMRTAGTERGAQLRTTLGMTPEESATAMLTRARGISLELPSLVEKAMAGKPVTAAEFSKTIGLFGEETAADFVKEGVLSHRWTGEEADGGSRSGVDSRSLARRFEDLGLATEKLTKYFDEGTGSLKGMTEAVKLVNERIESGRDRGPAYEAARGQLSVIGRTETALSRLATRAEKEDWSPERLRAEAGSMLSGMDQELQGGGGVGAFGALKKLAIGWTPMQMQRAWGITGGPVFNQMIPAAAQAEMQGWQLTQAMGGATGALPEGVAGGVMQYAAARRQSMIEGGRAGYRAWGAGLDMMGPMREMQGVFGPAAGAGLVTGIGLAALGKTAMLGTTAAALAGPVGVTVALGAAGIAGESYLRSFADETVENQLAAADSGWGRAWSGLGSILEAGKPRGPQEALPFIGGPARIARMVGAIPEGFRFAAAQAEAGEQLMTTPLAQMTAQQQMGGLNWAAQQLQQQQGTVWAGMDEGQVLQSLRQFTPYSRQFSQMTPQQMATGIPDWIAGAVSAGVSPGQYAGLSQALGLGTEGATQLTQMMVAPGVGDFERLQQTTALGQYAGLTRFGVSGGEIMANVQTGDWGELTGQPAIEFQRLLGSDRSAWARRARQGQVPAWAMTQDQRGFDVGTMGFGELEQAVSALPAQYRYFAGDVGAPAALMDTTGGDVPLLGGRVGQVDAGGTWGLQQWQKLETRAYQDWETQYQREGLQMQRDYLMGSTSYSPFGYGTDTYQRGVWDIEDDMRDVSRQASRAQFGAQFARLELQGRQMGVQYGTGADLGGWSLQDIETRYERGLAGLETSAASAGLQYRQQMVQLGWREEDLGRQWGRQQVGFQWQEEALGRQWGRSQTQWEWQEEDFAKQRAVSGMQFGWQMEDFEENIRFATGRQRKQLLRQRERATTMYGIQEEGAEEEESRMKERRAWQEEDHQLALQQLEQKRGWAQEDFDVEMERMGQRRQWAEEAHGITAKSLEDRRKYLEEDHAKELERTQQQKEWAEESLELSKAQAGAAAAAFEERVVLEDELTELQRAHQVEQMDRQEEAITKAVEHRDIMREIEDLQSSAAKKQELLLKHWEKAFEPSGEIGGLLRRLVRLLDDVIADGKQGR